MDPIFNDLIKVEMEPNNNNRSRDYEDHYAFMATLVCPNSEAPGDDDKSVHHPSIPVQTPANVKEFFATDIDEELYEENKKLHTVLQNLENFLQAQNPKILHMIEKNEYL